MKLSHSYLITLIGTKHKYMAANGNATKLNGTLLSGLSTGLLKNTTATGVPSSVVMASGIETFITTPSSANLATAVTDETGSGVLVFGTGPTITLASASTAVTQTPSDNSTKLATTAYVDAAVLGQNFKEACGAATTANLVGIYLNGTAGVGATFTYTATGVDVLDGVTLTLGMRVLLKNQTTDFQNGIYTVTTAGAIGIAGILTRATDSNQSSEWKTGDSTFVTAGTTQATTTWAYTGIDSPTMGTTSITFAQTAGQGSFTAGNGIAITGNSIALATTITGLTSVTSTTFVGALTGNASTVTTNANLTGVITSSGNATSIASQTGTGTKFVVDTSPTIITPTIASFTNATHNHTNSAGGGQLTDAALSSAVTVSKGGTGLTTTTAYGVIHAGTTATGNFQNSGTPGASGTVYTSTGTTSLPTWQAPTAPLATVKIATDFATSARFGTAITGAGTNSYGVGLDMNTGAGAGSIDSRERITEQGGAILGSPTLTISSISFQQVGTTVNYFFGLSNGVTVASTGITYTDKHIGFKLTASGTTLSLFATQADGTTENASAALVTFVATDEIDLIIHVNGTSSVDYYYRKNGGALSSATNLTSNMPTGAMNYAQYSVSNVNTTQRSEVIILGSCWER